MRAFLKYTAVSLLFIMAYLASVLFHHPSQIKKEIAYTSANASELYIVWGLMKGGLPPEEVWPANSYRKDNVIYTKMTGTNDQFSVNFVLPVETEIYYWIVQKKDKEGHPIDIWDSGGVDKEYSILHFTNAGISWPGLLLLIGGTVQLLMTYLSNRKKQFRLLKSYIFWQKEYIPQFDSIRAIAVLLVIIHHWLPEKSVLNFLPNGRLGVNIFFVLSGFLITGILLKAKKQVEEGHLRKRYAFKTFYIRRTLRIFPIYYLLLFVFLLSNLQPINEGTSYYFTYTANLLFYGGQYFPGRLSHLWSLAVEEQFYLLWPWLIILLNRNFLPYVIGFFWVVGISSNYIFTNQGWWVEIFTPACFDAFATGAFLSYLIAYRPDIIEKIQPRFKFICIAAGGLILLDIFNYSFLPARTIHSLLAATIIYYCLFKNNHQLPNIILNSRWLKSLGKISYGVYLYHLFVPELWQWINQKFYNWGFDPFFNKVIPVSVKPFWLFMQEFAFLILLCVLSWHLIEKPINNLKKRFEYNELKPSLRASEGEINVAENAATTTTKQV